MFFFVDHTDTLRWYIMSKVNKMNVLLSSKGVTISQTA
jgi:hypothetical protein